MKEIIYKGLVKAGKVLGGSVQGPRIPPFPEFQSFPQTPSPSGGGMLANLPLAKSSKSSPFFPIFATYLGSHSFLSRNYE